MKSTKNPLVALVAMLTTLILGSASLRAQTPVALEAWASSSVPVTKAGMESFMFTSEAVVHPAGWASAAPNFGCRLRSATGLNGVLVITRAEYSWYINGSSALNGLNQPIAGALLGQFNAPGDALRPDMRNFSSTDSVTASSGATAGSSTAGTNRFILEDMPFTPTGSTRRPFLAAPGDNYQVEFHITGSFNGTAFDLRQSARVIAAPAAPASLTMEQCEAQSTQEVVSLSWPSVTGADYYEVYRSEDAGVTWLPIASTVLTHYDVTGLDPLKQYLLSVVTVGPGPGGVNSVRSATVAPRRIVSTGTDDGDMLIGVYGSPVGLGDFEFSTNLHNWGFAPEGVTLSGSGTSWTLRVPINTTRYYIRLKCGTESVPG